MHKSLSKSRSSKALFTTPSSTSRAFGGRAFSSIKSNFPETPTLMNEAVLTFHVYAVRKRQGKSQREPKAAIWTGRSRDGPPGP